LHFGLFYGYDKDIFFGGLSLFLRVNDYRLAEISHGSKNQFQATVSQLRGNDPHPG
jgi:hypothetical protein